MKRKLMLLSLVLCLASSTAWAKPKLPAKLTIELDRTTLALHEAVTGRVKDLGVGEKFTLDLVDGYGKVLDRQKLKRKGNKGTPFTIRLKRFSTASMYVYVKGATDRTGIARLTLMPPDSGWQRVLGVRSWTPQWLDG